jgi:hypothetical protein
VKDKPARRVPTMRISDVRRRAELLSNERLFRHMWMPLIQRRTMAIEAAAIERAAHATA